MKILHLYKTYYPHSYGGIEKCIQTLSKHTSAQGFQNELLTCAPIKHTLEQNVDGLKVTYCPTTLEKASCPISLSFLKNFKEKAQQADLLHFHFPWPFADFALLMSGVKTPYIVTYHSDIIKQKLIKPFYSPLMKLFLRRAHKVVATSDNYVNSSAVLIKLKNVAVVPIGLDDCYYPTMTNADQKPYFLFVGALREYKGLHYLVDAMKGITEFDLIIAGDGPCYAMLHKKITDNKISNVKLFGKVDEHEKWALFADAYGVVSSAHQRNEAYCYMLVEGLMFGKPLISTEINTGTSYVNRHGETGIVVPPESPIALRNAMIYLFNNKLLAEEYGSAGREQFLRLFVANKMSKGYLGSIPFHVSE